MTWLICYVLSDYKEDPYSEHNPCNTICCRGDLMEQDPRPDGCYDTKVSSRLLQKIVHVPQIFILDTLFIFVIHDD